MSVLHLNESEFNEKIPTAPIAMVDFWATWCGPCKMLAPVVEDLGKKYEGKALIGKVDVDENQALAGKYGVMSIPTVIFFKDGKELEERARVIANQTLKEALKGITIEELSVSQEVLRKIFFNTKD